MLAPGIGDVFDRGTVETEAQRADSAARALLQPWSAGTFRQHRHDFAKNRRDEIGKGIEHAGDEHVPRRTTDCIEMDEGDVWPLLSL
jgi:hypothetical protein